MDRTGLLKKLIKATGLNIKTFSKNASIPYTTLYSILERGVSKASSDNVIKICKAIGITIDELEIISDEDDYLIESYIERYAKRLNSRMGAHFLNEEFLVELSKIKNITIHDAEYFMKRMILKDKLDIIAIDTYGQEELLNNLTKELLSNKDDIDKNISKTIFIFTVNQIIEKNYDKGDLGFLIDKAKDCIKKYPEFIELIEDNYELRFLSSGNINDIPTKYIDDIGKYPSLKIGINANESSTSELMPKLDRVNNLFFDFGHVNADLFYEYILNLKQTNPEEYEYIKSKMPDFEAQLEKLNNINKQLAEAKLKMQQLLMEMKHKGLDIDAIKAEAEINNILEEKRKKGLLSIGGSTELEEDEMVALNAYLETYRKFKKRMIRKEI